MPGRKLQRTVFHVFIIAFVSTLLNVVETYSFFDNVKSLMASNVVTAPIFCKFKECCRENWIVNDITGLQRELDSQLYGQHIVQKAVVRHIQSHVRTDINSPDKALALTFHGPTGTGKNHVSRIIAEVLYKKGLDSENVHLISVPKEFPHSSRLSDYKDKLQKLIDGQVKKCPQSLFIFDEIDKMPRGLIDIVKPYLEYHHHLGGVDYRRAIFLFLSNSGDTAITEYVLEQYREGRPREDIKLVDVEKILAKAAFNSEGLWHSELIGSHLITAFLPFMPLERRHVRLCVLNALVKKRYYSDKSSISPIIVNEVMGELTFFPEEDRVFSVTGCKRISDKVDFVMQS